MTSRRASWRRSSSTQAHSSLPRSQKQSPSLPFTGVEDNGLTTVLTSLLARNVTVKSTDGAEYVGLFAGTERSHNKHDLFLLIRYAKFSNVTKSPCATIQDARGAMAARVLIPISSVITVRAAPFTSAPPQLASTRRFATDTQISRGTTGAGRQLKRFDDFNDPHSTSTSSPPTQGGPLDQQTFGDLAGANKNEKWDQFQVNHQKFGVKTSFDENEYTTKIDRSQADFAERQRLAARLAMEIEKEMSGNVHLREERNQEHGNDYDEEARYSGVHRPTDAPQSNPSSEPTRPPERPKMSYAAAAAAANARQRPAPKSVPTGPKTSTNNSKQLGGTVKEQPTNSKTATPTSKPSSGNTRVSQQPAKLAPGSNTKQTLANGKTPVSGSRPVSNSQNVSSSKLKGASSNPKVSTTSSKVLNPNTNAKAHNAAIASKSRLESSPGGSTRADPGVASTDASKAASAKPGFSPSPGGKDKEMQEKVLKPVTTRERSGRDSHPQLMKVRKAHTGRTSPNQSRNSPLPTPVSADTSAVAVLNLDAQTPNLGPEQIKRFEQYKANREMQSMAANREKITDDLKKFSTQLDSRNGSLRRGQNSTSHVVGTSSPTPQSTSSANKSGSTTTYSAATVASTAVHGKAERAGNTTQNLRERTHDSKDGDVKQDASPTQGVGQQTLDALQKSSGDKSDKPTEKDAGGTAKPRTKSKVKLNPNAQEFKFNPDAPSFKPSPPPAVLPPSRGPQQAFNQYPPTSVGVEFSQPMQAAPHQGYAMPVQPVPPLPYGGQPYMLVPAVPAQVAGSGGTGFQYMQGAAGPGSFSPSPVPGRFPQQGAVPVSYGYTQVTPIVMAQPQQRVASTPYNFYSGPFAGGQGGAPHVSPLPQQHMFPPHQRGGGHMAGAPVSVGARGGHGNGRRGGQNKARGKQYGHHVPIQPSGSSGNMDRQTPKSPQGLVPSEGGQR